MVSCHWRRPGLYDENSTEHDHACSDDGCRSAHHSSVLSGGPRCPGLSGPHGISLTHLVQSITMGAFVKLDAAVAGLLCCPLCKSALLHEPSQFICVSCRSVFPLVGTSGGDVFDFRIHHPSFLMPPSAARWETFQSKYEDYI